MAPHRAATDGKRDSECDEAHARRPQRRRAAAAAAGELPEAAAAAASRELTAAQFSHRLRGPTAWVKRPRYDAPFLQQYRAPATSSARLDLRRFFAAPRIGSKSGAVGNTATASSSIPASGSATTAGNTVGNTATASSSTPASSSATTAGNVVGNTATAVTSHARPHGRPQRAAAQSAFDLLMRQAARHHVQSSDDDDDDDAAVPLPAKLSRSQRAGKRKRSSSAHDAESEYEEESGCEESQSEYDEHSAHRSSPSATSGEDAEPSGSESDAPVRPKPANKPSAAAAGVRNATGKSRGSRRQTRMVNLKSRKSQAGKAAIGNGLDMSLPPISDIRDIFRHLTSSALAIGLGKTVEALSGRPVRVATMCSGTESPLLALEMISESLSHLGVEGLHIRHLFSAEIVPFKQAYIERNFSPPIIFRDITEMAAAIDQARPEAITAYGARSVVPVDVDMIIAGTSCVDFSNRNKHKKGLEDGGESGDTFEAVLSYCRAYRPTIVLLENVSGAPYDQMMAKYEAIGYATASVGVDTKNHYLPQTRQRGYMVCFNTRGAGNQANVAAMTKKWEHVFDRLQRYASSPISSFLLPANQISHKHILTDAAPASVDWSTCEITQMDYRQKKKLGSSRPVTHWTESGSVLPPDNAYGPFFRARVERELDTIDCSLLRKARPENGMYDIRFKTRPIDLSQNVYMNEDTNPFGISGCLTPSMRAFISDAMRGMDAKESLQLQGIPLHKISFTTETHANIQDLAGNAMSSTVVGTSILAALMSSAELLLSTRPSNAVPDAPDAPDPATSVKTLKVATCASETVEFQDISRDSDLTELIARARQSLRRCHCEGSSGVAANPIQRCLDCGHTTCTACGGNPQHRYRSAHLISQARSSPADFDRFARTRLPLRLSFASVELPTELPERYRLVVDRVIKAHLCFQSIRRTHCWTITYECEPHGRLELVIDDHVAEWRLYAHPDQDLPGNDAFRALLQQPVLRSNQVSSLHSLDWQVRVPRQNASTPLTIQASEQRVPSWWSRIGLPDFREHTVPEHIVIEVDSAGPLADELNGSYKYLPRCGTACDGLYVRAAQAERDSMYFFLDPHRVGNPREDSYVFSRNKHTLEYDETRPVIACVSANWRPWTSEPNKTLARESKATLRTADVWKELSVGLVAASTHLKMHRPSDLERSAAAVDCSKAVKILGCIVPRHLLSPRGRDLDADGQHRIDDRFYRLHAWIMEAMRRELGSDGWRSLDCEHARTLCETCSPPLPPLRWHLVDGSIKEFEDPASAALYEHAIKSRSEAIALHATHHHGGLAFDVVANVTSLAQRATSRLTKSVEKLSHEWRLDTSSGEASFVFRSFKLQPTRDAQPYDGSLQMSVQLFPKQLQAVSWMKKQEKGVLFELEETEEACIRFLGWRAEVRAYGDIEVRGGVCADHPGFGKTITSLALIRSELLESTKEAILSGLESRQSRSRETQGLIPTAATLIVCPISLHRQWIDEIRDKIGSLDGVLSVPTTAGLGYFTLDDFRRAKIIVLSRAVLVSDSYIDRLAAFAAIPGPATRNDRGLAQWLAFAKRQVPEHLPELLQNGESSLKKLLQRKYRINLDIQDFKAAVPSRRLRGKDYVAAKQSKATKVIEKPAPKDIDTSQVARPLFEMFFFNRVIVDEFHQFEPKEHAATCAIKADKRWLLSGTPAIGDFYEVAQMAKLLGVPLRTGREDRTVLKANSIRELQKCATDFERFNNARQMSSNAVQQRIHTHQSRFLETFVRQNIMDFAEFKVQEHLVPVQLDVDHAALYAEVCQQLNSLDMRIKKGRTIEATDRDGRYTDATKSSLTAEEALSKLAAFYDRTSNVSLDALVAQRQEDVRRISRRLPECFAIARREEPTNFSTFQTQVENGDFGDEQATADIRDMMRKSQGTVRDSAKATSDDDSDLEAFKPHPGKSRTTKTAILNRLCKRLVTAKRSARYLLNIMALQAQPQHGQKCDAPDCAGKDGAVECAVSSLCGHTICRTCFQQRKEFASTQCAAPGCTSSQQDFHLLWINKLQSKPRRDGESPYGAKLDAATALLHRVARKHEQAILFVQFEQQLREAAAALDQAGISHVVVYTAGEASSRMSTFRESAAARDPITVIVLNASDETAAGSNLQNANHVIFLSPLLRDTQYSYDATNAQAIGRVRRYGQTRDVHVYRILALHTIDVDILEHRHRRADAVTEDGAPAVSPPDAARPPRRHGQPVPERTQLVREHGRFSLRPHSWLVRCGADRDPGERDRVQGKNRILGWHDFSSLVKFSRAYTEEDD